MHHQYADLVLRDNNAAGCIHGVQEVRSVLRADGGYLHEYSQQFQPGAPLLHFCDRGRRADDRREGYIQGGVYRIRVVANLYLPGGINSADVDPVIPKARDLSER